MNAPYNPHTAIRRFQRPDLDTHGPWLLPRFIAAYPQMDERRAASFLTSILTSNEHLFLCSEHGAALAQLFNGHSLVAKPVVYERFVWAKDPQNKVALAAIVQFYAHVQRWAKALSCETLVVEEMTDVPSDTIRAQLGRIFTREQRFVKL